MTIDYNNNSIFDFNASPSPSSSSRALRGAMGSSSQISQSDSMNSLVSLWSNVSCSSISSMVGAAEAEKSLSDLEDVVKFMPAIPSEDEDEDWIQFGYLLEDNENVLPTFENLKHRHNHRHHHRHHHLRQNFQHPTTNGRPIFHRSYSLPSTSDIQNQIVQSKRLPLPNSPLSNSTTASEYSENSLSSLRVEASLTPPSSPSPSCASATVPYFQASEKSEILEAPEVPSDSDYPETPFTKKDASSTLAALNFYSNPSNYDHPTTSVGILPKTVLPNSPPISLKRSHVPENDEKGKSELEVKQEEDNDEPIAKRTRRRDSQKLEDVKPSSTSGLNTTNSPTFSPYRVTARPWWMSKLLSMRRQNTKRRRKPATKSNSSGKLKSVRKSARLAPPHVGKAIKRQTVKKEGAATNAESFSLCDPRYISLGGNTVPLEEMPMRMELDLSGNAKITTNSEMMQNAAASAAAAAAHEENDESDEADENRAARKTASGDGDGNGNDESENDDSTDDERSEGGADMSLDEEAQNGDALLANGAALGGGNASSQKPRMAKFASLTKTGLKKEMAGVGRLESKRERTKREAEKRKAQKKEEKLKLKLQKKRNVSQQRRRDRERRVHMIHMRKMMKNGAAPPPNPLSSDDNGAEDEHETVKTYSRMARIGATTPLVKKSSVVGSAAVLKRKTIAQKSDASADAAAKDSGPAKYCPCGGSYDAKKFYISCDECSRWYHGKCAGVTEKRAAKLAEEAKSGAGWTCADCEKARTQSSAEVYCVCRRPYDDAKFYVGCDSCEDWFHPECIGTTQAEVSKLDTFLCPKCRESEDI